MEANLETMKLSPHFSLWEMLLSETAARKGIDNTPTDCEIINMVSLCENFLEPVRDGFGELPIRVLSGYRGPRLNKAVGGSATSDHKTGCAVDFYIQNTGLWYAFRRIAPNFKFDQLIFEFGGWIHASYISPEENRGEVLIASKQRVRNWLGFTKLVTTYETYTPAPVRI